MATAKQEQQLLEKGRQLADRFNVKQREEYAQAYVDYFLTTKTADRKLRALESLSHEQHFKGVLSYSYARAQKDIAKWKGQDYARDSKYARFSTLPPESLSNLLAKTNDAQRFIDARTSSKAGIVKMYKKRADTMNAQYSTKAGGKKLTWQELAKFFEKEYNTKLDGKVGSASVFVALGVMKRYKIDDSDLFEKLIKMRSNEEYAKEIISGATISGDNISDEDRKKLKYSYLKIQADKNTKFIKSPKIQNDIAEILKADGVDISMLFEDSKAKG